MPVGVKCGAHNRQGKPCGKWALRGKTRCKLHGGASTGPRTAGSIAKVAASQMTHGAGLKLTSYQAMLAKGIERHFNVAPDTTSLKDELRFARAKLLHVGDLAAEPGLDVQSKAHLAEVQATLLGRVQTLATSENEMHPGGDAQGAFTLKVKIVDQRKAGG